MLGALSSFLRPASPTLPVLSGPAFVLGSGPGASLPEGISSQWVLATVNASQAAATKLGLDAPDITLFGASVMKNEPGNLEAQAALVNGKTTAAVCLKGRRRYSLAPFRLLRLNYQYESFHFWSREARLDAVSRFTGEPVSHKMRPSNGVALAFLCLHLGCSKVVMSGFSLTQGGHSYNNANRDRRHISEDKSILMKAVERGMPISTNDPVFSEESGVPLYRHEAATKPSSPVAAP